MTTGLHLVRVEVHSSAVTALKKDAGVKADVRRRMERALDQARADAPVLTGNYRDNLHLEEQSDGSVRLVSDVEYTMTIEAHNGVLARSLDAAGGS